MAGPRVALARKLALAFATVLVAPIVVFALALLALSGTGVYEREPSALAVAVAVGAIVVLAYVSMTGFALGRWLVRTIQHVHLETELMATIHPEHRISIRTGDELEMLAGEINRLADQARSARVGLEQRTAAATHALDAERRKLADVLESLSETVLLLALDGRVTLANRAARAVLGNSPLGRSVFELADRERLEPYLERIRTGCSALERIAVADSAFEADAAPFHDADQRVVGFALVVRATRALESPRFAGMGTRSAWPADAPAADRPDLYDFALLSVTEPALNAADRSEVLAALTYVAFDLETTGLRPDAGDRIVSIAGVKFNLTDSRRTDVFDALVNPGRRIPSASTSFHGITDDLVRDAPRIEAVLPAFVDFVAGTVLVGHQVSFDLRFLERATRRLGLPPLTSSHPVLDTLLLSAVVHGPLNEHGLDAVATRLGVSVEGRHSALGDARATAEILRRLIALLSKRNVLTLGQALDAARKAEPGLFATLHDA